MVQRDRGTSGSPGAWLITLGADLGLETDRTSIRLNLLEQEFGALPLGCKASDGPHFDLNACVELFVPHVPHSLDRRGDCFVLQNRAAALLRWTSCEVCVVSPRSGSLGVAASLAGEEAG